MCCCCQKTQGKGKATCVTTHSIAFWYLKDKVNCIQEVPLKSQFPLHRGTVTTKPHWWGLKALPGAGQHLWSLLHIARTQDGKISHLSSWIFTEPVGLLQNQQVLSSAGCCETLPLSVCRQLPLPQQPLCLCSLQIIPGFTSKGGQFSGRTGYVHSSLNVGEWKTPIRQDSAPCPEQDSPWEQVSLKH